MAVSIETVASLASRLPEVTEGERHGNLTWFVAGKPFAWERPFSKADLRRFGDATPPDGPILAVRVGDLSEKEALLAANPGCLFTIPHFDGYAAVLVELNRATRKLVGETLLDGWHACAPGDQRLPVSYRQQPPRSAPGSSRGSRRRASLPSPRRAGQGRGV